MSHRFRGTGTALVTPFTSSGEVDYKSLEKIINHNIENNIDYLVSLGTTGEAATLSDPEKHKILDFTVAKAAGRVPVIAGFGGNDTAKVINSIKDYHFDGIHSILSVSPYYNKPNQEGIFRHYQAIADTAPLPVIVYNVPSRTGANIKAETTLRLAEECPNISGIKEASCDFAQITEILKHKPADFALISGDDLHTLPLLSMGADGVISVVTNAFPREFSSLVQHALAGENKPAAAILLRLSEIIRLLFADGSPGGIKYILTEMGLCENHLRLPLVPICEQVAGQLQQELNKFSMQNV